MDKDKEKQLRKKLKQELRKRLKRLRIEENLSIEELSEKINVPVEDIIAYEKGKKNIPLSYATKLCKLIGIQVRYLINDVDIK